LIAERVADLAQHFQGVGHGHGDFDNVHAAFGQGAGDLDKLFAIGERTTATMPHSRTRCS